MAVKSSPAGDETMTGGSGNDTMSGAVGADTIVGGAGDETLSGDAGSGSAVAGGDPLDAIRAQIAELQGRTEAAEARAADAEGRAEAAEARAAAAEHAVARMDPDGDGKAGRRRPRGKGELQPEHMVAAERTARTAAEVLGDGLFSHLANMKNSREGDSDSDARLASLFSVTTDDVRAAAEAHSGLKINGTAIQLA